MPYANPALLDAALDWARTNGTTLHFCSAEPATYAEIAAVELASAPVTLGANEDGTPDGRQAEIPAVTGDDVDTTGTATHWVLSNGVDTLVASNQLDNNYAVDENGVYNFSGSAVILGAATSV